MPTVMHWHCTLGLGPFMAQCSSTVFLALHFSELGVDTLQTVSTFGLHHLAVREYDALIILTRKLTSLIVLPPCFQLTRTVSSHPASVHNISMAKSFALPCALAIHSSTDSIRQFTASTHSSDIRFTQRCRACRKWRISSAWSWDYLGHACQWNSSNFCNDINITNIISSIIILIGDNNWYCWYTQYNTQAERKMYPHRVGSHFSPLLPYVWVELIVARTFSSSEHSSETFSSSEGSCYSKTKQLFLIPFAS